MCHLSEDISKAGVIYILAIKKKKTFIAKTIFLDTSWYVTLNVESLSYPSLVPGN